MGEQLAKLKEQRELIRQHLKWLDSQIQAAEASGDKSAAPTTDTIQKSSGFPDVDVQTGKKESGLYDNRMQCTDLKESNFDYEHIKMLCNSSGYQLYPAVPKYSWTQEEILECLKNKSKEFSENIEDEN